MLKAKWLPPSANWLVPGAPLESLNKYNQELLKSCDLDADREHYRKDATIAELYAADKAACWLYRCTSGCQ